MGGHLLNRPRRARGFARPIPIREQPKLIEIPLIFLLGDRQSFRPNERRDVLDVDHGLDTGSTMSVPPPASRRREEPCLPPRPILRSEMQPAIRYAKNGEVHLAYEVVGSGPIDILSTPAYPFAPPLD